MTNAFDSKSTLELKLLFQMRLSNFPEPEFEYKFHEGRRWRFDFAWVDKKLAVEVEGGAWIQGRHTRPQGFIKDCEKYNQAVMDGWRVLRYPPEMIDSGEALTQIEAALNA